MFTKSTKGELLIDQGAATAVVTKGKSLLPSGILAVKGKFRVGDAVRITGRFEKEIAVGLTNYDASDIKRIAGRRTSEIESILGFKHADEVIHRDNLALAEQMKEGDDECRFQT